MTMPVQSIELRIQTSADAGELLGLLGDPMVSGAWQEPGAIRIYWPESHWTDERLEQVQAALAQLDPGATPLPALTVHCLPAEDWNRRWSESVRPLRVGPRLVIRPSWEAVELQPHEIELVLDPKQAFGTGHHATTRMLLEWLQEDVRTGESVLDVGTGSGILVMAALRLGAVCGIGVECDPVAADCAREYAAGNGFGRELTIVGGTLDQVSEDFRPDLVLANLDRSTLLAMAKELAVYGGTGARLLLSGLLSEQEDDIAAAYAAQGLYVIDRREQDGWVALKLARPDSCEGEC